MTKLANAFSLSMLDMTCGNTVKVEPLATEQAKQLLSDGFESVVGHQSTADLFSSLLETEVAVNRSSVKLDAGDKLLVGQYAGPRLEEGVTTLPDGASLVWLLVELV